MVFFYEPQCITLHCAHISILKDLHYFSFPKQINPDDTHSDIGQWVGQWYKDLDMAIPSIYSESAEVKMKVICQLMLWSWQDSEIIMKWMDLIIH